MLTPKKIRGYQFQSAGRGTYKAGEVDEFFEQVVDSFEQVFKENGELVRKMGLLATKLEEYRKDEDNIRRALLNAQKMSDKIIDETKAEAKIIIDEANNRAQNVDFTTNAKIKVMVDEVESEMKIAFNRATEQAEAIKLNAQKESEKILTNAKIKAESMVDEAAKLSKGNLDQIIKDIEIEKAILIQLKEDSNKFKSELKDRYQKEIKRIDSTPVYVIEKISHTVQQEEISGSSLSQEDQEEVTRLVNSFVASQSETVFNNENIFNRFNYNNIDEKTSLDFTDESSLKIDSEDDNDEFIFEDFPIEEGNPNYDSCSNTEFQDVFSYDVSSNKSTNDENENIKTSFTDKDEETDFNKKIKNNGFSFNDANTNKKSPDFSVDADDEGVIYISKKRNKSNLQEAAAYAPDAFVKKDDKEESVEKDSKKFSGGFSINIDDLESISDNDTDSIFSGFFKQ